MRFAGLFFGFDVFDFFVGEEAGGEEEGGHFSFGVIVLLFGVGGREVGRGGGRLRVMGEEIRGVFMRNGNLKSCLSSSLSSSTAVVVTE